MYSPRMKRRTQPLGELALIEHIRQRFSGRSGGMVRLGIGDDCAILRPPAGDEVLVTTDFTLEERHFRRDWHAPESVGHRCLARGLSDLASMGATPMAAFLSLALPAGLSPNWVKRFIEGLGTLAKRSRVTLAGGDTSQSPAALIFADIVLLGTAPAGKSLRRSGARVGDRLYVTGALGGASAELQKMQAGRSHRARTGTWAEHPQMFPEPRLAVGKKLREKGIATACIDVSDGLSTDLAHICKASGVGARVEETALPAHPLAAKLGVQAALKAMLHGGEDYELLFTASPETRVARTIGGVAITEIGRIVAGPTLLVKPDGTEQPLVPGGWEHFKS